MPIRTETRSAKRTTTERSPDVRRYWRLVLAVVAPLPMLAKGAFYLLSPVGGDEGFTESVTAFRAHPELLTLLTALDAVFVVGLVPATFAVALAARRGAPRLTAAGATVALLGFLCGIALLGGILTPAVVTAQHGLDVAAVARFDEALASEPLLDVAGLLFITGVVVGLGLLGGALWRSRAVPGWVGIALLLGGATHPFIPGQVAQGIGLLVAAVGFAGAGLALLRLPDDEFDLPASRPDAREHRPEARGALDAEPR